MGWKKEPVTAGGKKTFAFTQPEVNDHLGERWSFGTDCEMELEQAAFLELEASIHSYLEENLCLQ